MPDSPYLLPRRTRVVGFILLFLSGFVAIAGTIYGLATTLPEDPTPNLGTLIILGVALVMAVMGIYWIINPIKIKSDRK